MAGPDIMEEVKIMEEDKLWRVEKQLDIATMFNYITSNAFWMT